MKNSLPSASISHESRIKEITDIIVKSAGDKVAFVILFGPFANGNWIRSRHVEDGAIYEYASDYNFLVITKTGKQAGSRASFDLERKIKKEIENSIATNEAHRSHIIIESMNHINKALEKSENFFSNIKKEGILLYNLCDDSLFETQNLNENNTKNIAQTNYEHWFGGASGFLIDYKNAFDRQDFKKAAFYLHQAAESFYNCVLLTLGGYKPRSHDLEELNQLCTFYSNDFLTIFPNAKKEEKESFVLLQDSYIDSRYSNNFNVTTEQLKYLFQCISDLQELVRTLCEKELNAKSSGY